MKPTWRLAFLFGLFLPLSSHAADWPEFRGPTGQGHYGGKLPVTWGPDQNVVWKKAIPGKGWSSPALVADRVYLTTAVPIPNSNDHALTALCLDAGNGATLWEREVFRQDGAKAPRIHNKNSHASPSPLVYGGKMFVHFGHQGTACLDLAGKILWRNADLAYQPVHGNGGTPILVGDRLVFSSDGGDQQFLVALDAASGRVLWKTPRPTEASKKFSFHTPLLIEVNGRQQVISAGSDHVGAFDPANGREIWQVRYHGYSVIPRPVYGHGLVFLSTSYDAPTLLAIRPDGQGDVTATHVAWKLPKGAPHTPSPLLVGDNLYVAADNGIASCLDAKTGKVHWQERLGGNYSASPLLADGLVYFPSEQGTTTVVKASTKYEVVARNVLNERTLASFAAANGALFLRTEGQLYRIEERQP